MADRLETNWARTHTFTAEVVHRPTSLDHLVEIVADARRVRAVGSGHSFTDVADAETMVDLSAMPESFSVADDRRTVTVGAHLTYARLFDLLQTEGLALPNTASLPHITVAGAVATATHGSGDGNGNLATAVAGLELVSGAGEVHRFERRQPDFAGVPIGLGSLGIVTTVTLDVIPAFDMKQTVFEDLRWEHFVERFDALFNAGYSVSAFHRFGPTVEQLWVKQLAEADDADPTMIGGLPAPHDLHPIREVSAEACTVQGGVVGPWSQRLPHFRPDAVPASGEEIQSEYFVDRSHAGEAVEALRRVGHLLAPALLAAEIRTVASDELWLSPQYQRGTVAFHFSWVHDGATAAQAAATAEDALDHLGSIPHWGKVYTESRFAPGSVYPRFDGFLALRDRLDPERTFANRWTDTALG